MFFCITFLSDVRFCVMDLRQLGTKEDNTIYKMQTKEIGRRMVLVEPLHKGNKHIWPTNLLKGNLRDKMGGPKLVAEFNRFPYVNFGQPKF